MAHDAREAISAAINPLERLTEQRVRAACAIDVRRDESARALLVGAAHEVDVALVVERLAEVHEASAAPTAESCSGEIHGESGGQTRYAKITPGQSGVAS